MVDMSMDLDETPESPPNGKVALMASVKGKGKAGTGDGVGSMSDAEVKAIKDREGLPWSVSALISLEKLSIASASLTELTDDRVEKYRPNTLDEVVSHKDITNTSQFLP